IGHGNEDRAGDAARRHRRDRTRRQGRRAGAGQRLKPSRCSSGGRRRVQRSDHDGYRGVTMTGPPYVEGDDGTGRGRVRVDAGRLWTGALATAVVAALVAVVGVLIARGLFDVPVLAPSREGVLGNANTVRLAGLAA